MRFILSILIGLMPPTLLAETYIVASQNIPYYPHYQFKSDVDKGYAWALLEAYSKQTGVNFEYIAMPVLRLQLELRKGNVDLIYPDNPAWTNPVTDNTSKYFSAPLTNTLVGTLVKPEHYAKGVERIRKLAFVLGFTPILWQDRIDSGKTQLISVADNKSALYLAQLDRADAVDMDYYVASYLMNTLPDIDDFVLDPSLPLTSIAFQLSTLNNPKLIDDINEFILKNGTLINILKEKYGIGDPSEALKRLQPRERVN